MSKSKGRFYSDAAEYWSRVPPTLEGVLGGFGHLSDADVAASGRFLDSLLDADGGPGRGRALDCGAGIGRVAERLLAPRFDEVDAVEQDPRFLEVARASLARLGKPGECYASGLQDFRPERRYDVVWCQWVLGHLTDDDLLSFFRAARDALLDRGVLVVKENVTSSGDTERDPVDSSVTRPLPLLLAAFRRSGLRVVRECAQTDFPAGVYPVRTFALRPKRRVPRPNHQ